MAPPDDRASLVRRRQQIRRTKENESGNRIASTNTQADPRSTSDSSERVSASTAKKASETRSKLVEGTASKHAALSSNVKKTKTSTATRSKPASNKSSGTTTSTHAALGATAAPNVALLIRQVLQRPHYGDLSEYLHTATKEQLFEQTLLIARAAVEAKTSEHEATERLESELTTLQSKYTALANDLAQSSNTVQALESDKAELLHRLALADDEYKSLLAWDREHEANWEHAEQALHEQHAILKATSTAHEEKLEQLHAVTSELQAATDRVTALQSEYSDLCNHTEALKYELSRLERDVKEERRENKELSRALQQQEHILQQMASEMEDVRSRASTLQGQVQLEVLSKQSIGHERAALQSQLARERDEWNEHEAQCKVREQRKTEQFRSMDMELRQLRQALSRLRVEWESEKSLREKAEASVLKLTEANDELRLTAKTLQADAQRLALETEEERATRASKEQALQLAYRDLQSLQQCCRDLESAKAEAQSEVESLTQRIKLIRRDHLAILHRVDTPLDMPSNHPQRFAEAADRKADRSARGNSRSRARGREHALRDAEVTRR